MKLPGTVLAASAAVTALVVAVVVARRAGVLGASTIPARGLLRRRGAAPDVHVEEAPFTSRPVPRSVAALTPAEQADSAMVHDG